MQTYAELAASRRQWIDEILIPWCRQASRKELLAALQDWADIAGKVDPGKTLWFWAWSRFPALVHEELAGIDETVQVTLTTAGGARVTGYPDARESDNGSLVLSGKTKQGEFRQFGPYSIDEVTEISRN